MVGRTERSRSYVWDGLLKATGRTWTNLHSFGCVVSFNREPQTKWFFPKDPHPKQNKGLVRGPSHPVVHSRVRPLAMVRVRTRILRVGLFPCFQNWGRSAEISHLFELYTPVGKAVPVRHVVFWSTVVKWMSPQCPHPTPWTCWFRT